MMFIIACVSMAVISLALFGPWGDRLVEWVYFYNVTIWRKPEN